MRSRKILIIAGFLTTWTFITYYFLIRNSTIYPLKEHLLIQKLSKLERESRIENIENSKLVGQLIEILKKTMTIDEVEEPQAYKEKTERPIGIFPLRPDHALSLEETQRVKSDTEKISEDNVGVSGKGSLIAIPTMTNMPNGEPVIPILVIACNRVSIRKCLDNLIQYRPTADQFPIIVSQVILLDIKNMQS